MPKVEELDAQGLRQICDPAVFAFKTTAELEPLDEVIGQQRAVQAIEFGLNMQSPGYNIFVTGEEGTGKSTIVKDIARRHARGLPAPDDWCMVYNFRDEYRPCALRVPSGQSGLFSKRMQRLIGELQARLAKAFEEAAYLAQKAELEKKYTDQRRQLLELVEKNAVQRGLKIIRTPSGFQPAAMLEDKPMTEEQFRQLAPEQQAKIEENIQAVHAELQASVREISKLKQQLQNDLEKLNAEVALFAVRDRLEILREDYRHCPDILDYLEQVQQDLVENVAAFVAATATTSNDEEASLPAKPSLLQKYRINVLVDRSRLEGAPVIFESNPTYQNLFGRIEKRVVMGAVMTDFSMVQAGSLLQADGGILVLEMEAVLQNPHVWDALKRTLQNKQLQIEDFPISSGFGAISLRPEPIPLDVKVILVGPYQVFQMLQGLDSKFNKIFRVRADFDNEAPLDQDSIQLYAHFIARVCREQQLLPFNPQGVAAIVEYGQKSVAHKAKLSLRFGPIVAILKEADYWARKDKAKLINAQHVVKAFNEYRFRHNLYEEKIHESYVDETILIDVDGAVVGQVNGLAVYQVGAIAFGRPSRITAEAYMGKPNVINVEREARLSGKTHDKGVLILSGYLGRIFAQKYPLSVTISIAFEQSYGGVDGDSASAAELLAVLSSLAGVPVDQGLAVTGSVNQKGQIQAIGGVNQKIEGFFDVCQAKGLTGRQGVVIPEANRQNLMLKRGVVDAVKQGRFQIYAVTTVEEGIEILTGSSAGKPDKNGNYPEKTVYGRVQRTLQAFWEQARRQYKPWSNHETGPTLA